MVLPFPNPNATNSGWKDERPEAAAWDVKTTSSTLTRTTLAQTAATVLPLHITTSGNDYGLLLA